MQDTSFKGFKLRWFIVLAIIMVIISAIYSGISSNVQYSSDIASIILVLPLLLYILYHWKANHISFNEAEVKDVMTNKRWAKYIGFTLFIKLTGVVLLAFISVIILSVLKDSFSFLIDFINNNIQFVEATPLNYVFLFISICILAPLWEELFFRGILLRRFAMKWSIPTSIIVSSLIFGLLHFGGSSIIHASLFGSFMAYAYLKTKNILVPIILHAITNFVSFITALISGDQGEIIIPTDSELQDSIWILGILSAVAIIVLIIILVKCWYKVREIPKIKEPVIETEPNSTLVMDSTTYNLEIEEKKDSTIDKW